MLKQFHSYKPAYNAGLLVIQVNAFSLSSLLFQIFGSLQNLLFFIRSLDTAEFIILCLNTNPFTCKKIHSAGIKSAKY